MSFNDIPLEDLADASNTARTFVVVLDSFLTAGDKMCTAVVFPGRLRGLVLRVQLGNTRR